MRTKIIKCKFPDCEWTSGVPATSRRECCPEHAREMIRRAAKRPRISRAVVQMQDGYRVRPHSPGYRERRARIVAWTDPVTRRYGAAVRQEESVK